jgi:hypothetical protein
MYSQAIAFEPKQEGYVLQAPVKTDKLANSIRLALVSYDWVITEEKDGVIFAKYEKSNGLIVANIKISYDAKAYSLEYVDSKNLDYNPKTKKIHRNYVRWVNNLNKVIYQTYLTQS